MRQDRMVEDRGPRVARHGTRERLLKGLPVVERKLELAAVSTAVLEGGDGPPLVLLHGPGEHALKWGRVIPALVRDHRVVAPDLPGHGSSAVRGDPMSAERVLAWLGELLDATCTAPPVLVGQVVGGAVAARLAAGGRPLAHLVLVDALGLAPFQPAPEFGEAVAAFLAEPDELTFGRLWRQCAFDLGRLQAGMGEQWHAYAAYTLERVRRPETRGAVHHLMTQFGFPAIPAEELARIGVPTTLIWGRQDLATALAVAEEASARYGWPLRVVEDSGDDPPFEQPERFLVALRAALAPTRGVTARN
jgi:pimeloyl-ACP methyl ester carboxylesterase